MPTTCSTPFPFSPAQLDLSGLNVNQTLAEFLGSGPGPDSLDWLSLRATNLRGGLPELWTFSTSLSKLFLQDNALEGMWFVQVEAKLLWLQKCGMAQVVTCTGHAMPYASCQRWPKNVTMPSPLLLAPPPPYFRHAAHVGQRAQFGPAHLPRQPQALRAGACSGQALEMYMASGASNY